MSVCGFGLKVLLDFESESGVPGVASIKDVDPKSCSDCPAVGSKLWKVGGFLGGAPTTKNMSQTLACSGNSLTGWYLCVRLPSRSLWMRASIFFAKSFPWCLINVTYLADVEDELDEAGADIDGPEPYALPDADEKENAAGLVGVMRGRVFSDILLLLLLLPLFFSFFFRFW